MKQAWLWFYEGIYIRFNPFRPNPGRRERINLKNVYFHTFSRCLKRFYEGLKGLHEVFWGTTKKFENQINLILISTQLSEMHGALRVNLLTIFAKMFHHNIWQDSRYVFLMTLYFYALQLKVTKTASNVVTQNTRKMFQLKSTLRTENETAGDKWAVCHGNIRVNVAH